MKNLYKKVSVIALSSMIIAGGIASSGINAQAYSRELNKQIQDIGKGARVYYEVKYAIKHLDARIEAVFSSDEDMNRYVSDKYWNKINRKSNSYKKAKKDLLKSFNCGDDSRYMVAEVNKRPLGDLFRIRYKGYSFLIRRSLYKDISQIHEVSEQDLNKNLKADNIDFYKNVLKPMVEKHGARVVMISDAENGEAMKEYINDRFAEGVFQGNEGLQEELLVGLDCGDGSLEFNIEHRYRYPVMRVKYHDIDMLIIYDK